ncbi:MAG TPA: hypothetical protein VF941_06190, partial [Clostridia bacterium]
EPIDTPEKEEAWFSIVKFLDEVEEMNYPKEMTEMYEKLTNEDIEKYGDHINGNVERWLTITDEGLFKEREKILEYIKRIRLDNDAQAEYARMSNLSKSMKAMMNDAGYYDKFIKNLKILSRDYSAYIDKMTEFSKTLNIKVDDNGKITDAE